MRTATVLLADTYQLIAEGLRLMLEQTEGLKVVGTVCDGFAALEACQQQHPDLLLADAALPGLDPVEICRQLQRYSSPTRVLLTMQVLQHERLAAAAQAGAAGVVLKTAEVGELYAAIDAALRGQRRFPVDMRTTPSRYIPVDSTRTAATPYSRLTARERLVFKLLAEGHSVKQVAIELRLAPKTVDVHKTNLMRKLDVHDRGELIHFAFREGLIGLVPA